MTDRRHVAALTAAERDRFVAEHPRSRELFERAREGMPGDGPDYVDPCLGDTGAMTGHSPQPTVETVRDQVGHGITAMLPTEDSVVVAEELGRRFGLPLWQFTLSATDANRHAIRYARHLTGRRKVVVHDYCYHGSVDETFATLDGSGRTVARRGN